MRFKDRRGFTLIEMAIVVGIIGLLAAILVPIVFNQITSAEQARTEADCRSIATAMMLLRKDTGDWPCRSGNTADNYELIYGNGNEPDDWNMTGGQSDNMSNHLITNARGYNANKWAGPYIESVAPDPWGNRYQAYVEGFHSGVTDVRVWVISAGPNGQLETETDDTTLQGDDIGVMMR
jgi:prepilin-type N-terminal cleavage/methylation domain-containing protein